MTRYAPQWLQSGSYAASQDRRLIAALWPTAASTGCAVTAATGMAVNIAAGQVAVPTQNNTGATLCSSDAVEQVTLTAAPGSGTNRIDVVTCHPRGVDLDGGTNTDFIFDVITGTAVASPTPPAVPNGQVALAQIYVAGGSASIVAGNITDVRPGNLAVPGSVPNGLFVARNRGPAAQTDLSTSTNTPLVTISQTLQPGRYKISGRGQGACVNAAATWMNAVLAISPAADVITPFLFSANSAQISVSGQIAGSAFVVVTYSVPTAVTYSVAGAIQVASTSLLRFVANSCELLVEQIG